MTCANHPDRERIAFCQNCGKPLCSECSRVVGQAVFCEPCLAARLSAGPVPGNSAQAAGTAPGSAGWSSAAYATPPAGGAGSIPPPAAPGEPNPGLAALLGFIPGVGAFYNGQYAKGVIHLIVFAILISLADEHGIFGLFIAGWIFYQVIEAHHTARARRDGTPLPNPFGLNDVSERLGFGKAWPGTPTTPPTPHQQTSAPVVTPDSYAPPADASAAYGPAAGTYPAPASSYAGPVPPPSWGGPEESYAAVPPYTATQADPYSSGLPVDYGAVQDTSRKLPTGAFVLIGLGAFFLIANTGHFQGVPLQWFLPVLLIGLGVWTFVRRMTTAGMSLGDDGSPVYRYRLYNALRGSLWLVLIGILFFLDLTRILPWSRSWPLFIVVAGVIGLLKRAAYAGLPAMPFPGSPASGAPAAWPPPAPASTAMVQTDTTDPSNRS